MSDLQYCAMMANAATSDFWAGRLSYEGLMSILHGLRATFPLPASPAVTHTGK